MENPFVNVPNDIPLNNFQAQFNEGLMTMFYGYHPDAYYNGEYGNEHPEDDEDGALTNDGASRVVNVGNHAAEDVKKSS